MNLSGASLNDEKFMQDVFGMLAANIDIARHLCIEITESVALHDLNNTRNFIDTVRSYGAKVALDDFGAGYTSFSYLKELPADLLKIDGSFIVNMNGHPANVAIVEAIVNLAGTLGMVSVSQLLPQVRWVGWVGRNALPLLGLNGVMFHFLNHKLAEIWPLADRPLDVTLYVLVITSVSLLACVPLVKLMSCTSSRFISVLINA